MLVLYTVIGLLLLAGVIYLVNKIKNEKKNKPLNENAEERQKKL